MKRKAGEVLVTGMRQSPKTGSTKREGPTLISSQEKKKKKGERGQLPRTNAGKEIRIGKNEREKGPSGSRLTLLKKEKEGRD